MKKILYLLCIPLLTACGGPVETPVYVSVIDQESQQEKEEFHELEQWRERLINNPDALKEFIDQYPNTDIQSLRQQLRLHTTAKKPAQKTKAYRLIFQLVKDACSDH